MRRLVVLAILLTGCATRYARFDVNLAPDVKVGVLLTEALHRYWYGQ